MENKNILGISAFYHDSSAVILRGDKIVAAASEERFTRVKGDSGFPKNAIDFCLKFAQLSISDIDYIVFYDKPIKKFDRIIASYIHSAPFGVRSFLKAVPLWLKKKLWVEDYIKKELKIKKDIFFTEHHIAHAASAFFPSPFNEAAVLTIDGAGEWATTTIGQGKGNDLKILKEIHFPHSLGLLYSAFTQYCGFRVNSGEYKLMGLAPYGKPIYTDKIKKNIVNIYDDGSFTLNMKYFNYISGLKMINSNFEKLFGKKALKSDAKPDQFYMDIAASIQSVTDEIVTKLAKYAYDLTGCKNLVIAGGVGLNCVANAKIHELSIYDNIWVQPAAGDAGGSLGAAYYIYHCYLGNERKADNLHDMQQGSYLGPEFTNDEIQKLLDKYAVKYKKTETKEELTSKTAAFIKENKVVGWFQGRMEYGPRALGNRSILGNPQSSEMQKTMNLKIKYRESFRPFAPSVLEEYSEEYFKTKHKSPYMLFTAQVTKDKLLDYDESLQGMELLNTKRSVVPAITHVDNSARLQTVSKDTNPLYHSLISKFYEITNCPLVINTSFNVRGEPIVCTPIDALFCFMGTEMDILVIGDFIIEKDKQNLNLDLTKWKKTQIKD